MLVELSMVEQRYPAVREVLIAGAKISEVATRYGSTAEPSTAGCCATPTRVLVL